MTLLITVSSLVFGLLAGLVVALINQVKFPPIQWIAMFYLWLFRGTPVLFQIIFIYNVLPSFGIRLSAFASGVIALSLNEGAYIKTSALVSVIAVEELLLIANQTASATFRYFEALSAAGIYYLALTTIFMAGQYWMERSLEPMRKRQKKPSILAILFKPAANGTEDNR